MSLKSSRPEYRLQLPLSKKRVAFTAFTMRTERTMMLATQSGDPQELTAAVLNCINDNIRTDGIKAEEIPQAEAELLLLNMRSKSVGEKIELVITDPETGKSYDTSVALPDITIEVDKKYKDLIELSDGKVLKMVLPTMNALESIDADGNEFDTTINFLAFCIDQIVDDEEVYQKEDLTDAEIKDFLLDLDTGDFNRINDQFFNRIPKLSAVVTAKREDGTVLEVPVEGLASFL